MKIKIYKFCIQCISLWIITFKKLLGCMQPESVESRQLLCAEWLSKTHFTVSRHGLPRRLDSFPLLCSGSYHFFALCLYQRYIQSSNTHTIRVLLNQSSRILYDCSRYRVVFFLTSLTVKREWSCAKKKRTVNSSNFRLRSAFCVTFYFYFSLTWC